MFIICTLFGILLIVCFYRMVTGDFDKDNKEGEEENPKSVKENPEISKEEDIMKYI